MNRSERQRLVLAQIDQSVGEKRQSLIVMRNEQIAEIDRLFDELMKKLDQESARLKREAQDIKD